MLKGKKKRVKEIVFNAIYSVCLFRRFQELLLVVVNSCLHVSRRTRHVALRSPDFLSCTHAPPPPQPSLRPPPSVFFFPFLPCFLWAPFFLSRLTCSSSTPKKSLSSFPPYLPCAPPLQLIFIFPFFPLPSHNPSSQFLWNFVFRLLSLSLSLSLSLKFSLVLYCNLRTFFFVFWLLFAFSSYQASVFFLAYLLCWLEPHSLTQQCKLWLLQPFGFHPLWLQSLDTQSSSCSSSLLIDFGASLILTSQ